MSIPRSALSRPFIMARSPADAERYMAEFQRRLADAYPRQIDGAEDAQVPTLQQLRADGLLANELRASLAPIRPGGPLQPLPDHFGERLARDYPLVENEAIVRTDLHQLTIDRYGLPAGTCVFERESNLATVYLAMTHVGWDKASGRRRPASALPVGATPVASLLVLQSSARSNGDSDSVNATLLSAGTLALDVIGTLSWATPAGPFVSAAITIFQAILGRAFGSAGPSLIQQISDLSQKVVINITNYIEEQELQQSLQAVAVFAQWLNVACLPLDTQSPETYRFHMTAPNGVLAQLNKQLGSDKNSLFFLVNTLSADPDLAEGKAYANAHHRAMAEAKLRLFFFALALYFTALKLEMAMVAKLFAFGYDEHGNKIDLTDPTEGNPDNTFVRFVRELGTYRDLIPGIIARVRARRLGQIILREGWTEVAYSLLSKPVASRAEWAATMNRHDALYRGPNNDQLVRDKSDNPSSTEFEHVDSSDAMNRPQHGHSVIFHSWKRTEILDVGFDDGASPRNFVLHNADWGLLPYEQNTVRAEGLQAEYMESVGATFDAWARVPTVLGTTIDTIERMWVPKLPLHFGGADALFIEAFTESAKPASIWTDPRVQVRYRLSVTSTSGMSSQVSDGKSSSSWTAPKGRSAPKIVGLPPFAADPAHPSFEFIDAIRLYREFRIEQADGTFQTLPAVVIATIGRDEKAAFPASFIDRKPSARDEKALAGG